MHRLFLILSLFFLPGWIAAQGKVVYDSTPVAVRKFSAAALKNYKEDETFQYERVIEPPRSSWDRFWDWFWSKISEMLSSESSWTVIRLVFILAASAILVFFIMKLLGMTNTGMFGKQNKGDALNYSVSDEDIHAINFEKAIEEAINDRNFRQAVRLLYLQSLKKLADMELINWQINKTNVAYLQELSGNKLYNSFNNLTLQFENNWYGDLSIEENEFHAVKDQFAVFYKQLH